MAILTYMPTAQALGFTETQAKNQFAANRASLISNYDQVLTKAQYAVLFKMLADAGDQANWPTAREMRQSTGFSVQACQTVIDETIAGGREYKRLNP